jgi:hypothetical protein
MLQDNLVVARCRYQVMLAKALPRRLGHGVMQMSSHAGDSAIESCWQRCCRGDLATTQCRYRVMLVIMLLSHTGNGTATQGCTRCGKVVQLSSLEHRGVVAL